MSTRLFHEVEAAATELAAAETAFKAAISKARDAGESLRAIAAATSGTDHTVTHQTVQNIIDQNG